MHFSFTEEKEVKKFFLIFYIVGTVGMLIPFTFPLFKILIPFSLLLNFFYLIYFHHEKYSLKIILYFLLIFISSLIIEIIGVKTGKIFGYYEYGKSLGFKIFDTPVIIGLNWAFLIYASASVTERIKIPAILKIVLAPSIMLIYDIIIEQVAPKLDMWHWHNNIIPLKNYFTWFALAFFYHSLIKILKIKIQNPLALLILGCQFAFFILLLIFLK